VERQEGHEAANFSSCLYKANLIQQKSTFSIAAYRVFEGDKAETEKHTRQLQIFFFIFV
jgi:hypothetical protein